MEGTGEALIVRALSTFRRRTTLLAEPFVDGFHASGDITTFDSHHPIVPRWDDSLCDLLGLVRRVARAKLRMYRSYPHFCSILFSLQYTSS